MSRQALPVDELLSYAARTAGSIQVQLHLRDTELEPGSVTVRLRAGRRTLDSDAELSAGDTGLMLRFTVTGDLGGRVWRMILRPSDDTAPMPLQARLLAAPGLPVALLPGPTPATEMSPPAPRSSAGSPSSPSTARRLARRLPEPVKRTIRRGRTMIAARSAS